MLMKSSKLSKKWIVIWKVNNMKNGYLFLCLVILIISSGFVEESPITAILTAIIGCPIILFVEHKRSKA